MKKFWKRNQIMITALTLMIAIAGYLNFCTDQDDVESAMLSAQETEDEDLALVTEEDETYDELTDIDSMDSDEEMVYSDYLDTYSYVTDDYEGETPGEAVFTSADAISSIQGANLLKEQTREKNKETLLEIINSEELSDEAKKNAVDSMITLTDQTQKECSAEILLSAKGFEDAVVSITSDQADVIVATEELTDAMRAQILDIVCRKTGLLEENVIISSVPKKADSE